MSKCPYCGGNQLVIQITDKLICDGRRWKEGAYARCKKCGMSGPCVPHQTLKGLTRREAIHAFTRPAYLLNETDVLPPDDGTVPYIELTEARRLKEVAEAGIAQMKEAQMRGDLIRREDAERVFCDSIAKAKANLEAIPNRCAELLVGQTDAAVVRAMLTREIEGALAVVSGEVPHV